MSQRIELPVRAESTPIIIGTLLTSGTDNMKLKKSLAQGYYTIGLSLAPHRVSGKNVCPNSTPGCRSSCIHYSGYASVFSKIVQQRIEKTRALFANREWFIGRLMEEIGRAEKYAERLGKRAACRLNVFSDIAWEKIAPELFSDFPGIQYYDYSKRPNRVLAKELPSNYHLTFSRSEKNEADCQRILDAGKNVAVVFRHPARELPKAWWGRKVVDGDKNDLRFLDPRGVVVGLRAKGSRGKADTTGFVIDLAEDLELAS